MNNKCVLCGEDISQERIEGLKVLGIYPNNFTCIPCASATIKPYKALFIDNSGVSPMILADSLGEYGIPKEDMKEEENLDDF